MPSVSQIEKQMNRRKVWPWTFGVAAATLLATGLTLNGPFDLELSFGGLRALMLAFALAALVCTGVGIGYFGISINRTLNGSSWTPLLVATVSAASSALLLRALKFNVHLYGAWVMLFGLTLSVSGLAVVVLGSSALWGVVVRRSHKIPERGGTG
jgi:hypothetical protein